jgi:hypothetical protein
MPISQICLFLKCSLFIKSSLFLELVFYPLVKKIVIPPLGLITTTSASSFLPAGVVQQGVDVKHCEHH